MRILLIGATGQIGYALVQALASTRHDLAVLVRDRHKLPFPPGVRVVEAQVFTAEVFQRALAGVDHVIYGVGLPEQFALDETVFQRVNYGLLETFLEAFRQSGPGGLTVISTYEVFAAIDGVIRETHPIADETHFSPYFRAMIRAYRLAAQSAAETGVALTTIHPAAVYGGLDTSHGFNTFIGNLLERRMGRVPFVFEGRFPLVHAASLAEAIIRSLGHPGAFIVSEGMTSLHGLALAVRRQAGSYVPPVAPQWLVRLGVAALEPLARLTRTTPIMSGVQVKFITYGAEPCADRAVAVLGWQPMTLEEGIRRYLAERSAIPAV